MELLDVYNNRGMATGKTIKRGDKLNENEHIILVVIFIENDKGEFLIQKTSKEKGGYYSTTGGHVLHGEYPIDAIKREANEELGININKDKIIELGHLNYDMPIRYYYYLKKNIDIKSFIIQKEEVEFIKYISIEDIRKLINKKIFLESHRILFEEMLKKK